MRVISRPFLNASDRLIYLSGVKISESLSNRCASDLKFLHPDERDELSCRHYKQHLNTVQFVYSRLVLKIVLSSCLRADPSTLCVRSLRSGRPVLYCSGHLNERVHLSISHDREQVFVAAGLDCPCGVDVQALRGVDWSLVIRSMGWTSFLQTSLDQFSLNGLSFEHKSALFWAAFEAWFKLTGDRHSLSRFRCKEIKLIQCDLVTNTSIYEVTLSEFSPYSYASIFLSLRRDEVFAVAYF